MENIPFCPLDNSKLCKLFGHPCPKSKSLKQKSGTEVNPPEVFL